MALQQWLRQLSRKWFLQGGKRPRRPGRGAVRMNRCVGPRLELLEDRILLSADNWIGGSGNWDVGSNWDLGHAPGSGDTAVINTTNAATITIQSGDAIQVQSITTGSQDTLSITGGSLSVTAAASTLSGALSISGGTVDFSTGNAVQIASLTQSGGTLKGSDTVTVTGQLVWSGGTMSGTGVTVAQGTALFNPGLPNEDILDTRTFRNAGTATVEGVQGGCYIELENGSNFQNLANATLILQSDGGPIVLAGEGTWVNQGTLKCAGNSTIEIVGLNNSGSIDVQKGSSLDLARGVSSGVMTVEAGATLYLDDAVTLQDGASESGAGLLLINLSSTLTVNGNVSVQNLEQIARSQFFDVPGTLTGPGTLTIRGQLIWQEGTESGTGATVVQGTAMLSGSGKMILDTRTFQNAGTATWLNGEFDQKNGSSFQNLAGATLDIQAVGGAWHNDQNNTPLINQGTLKLSPEGNGSTIFGDIINSGIIDVDKRDAPTRQYGLFLQTGSVTVNGSGILACQPISTLAINGNLLGNTTNAGLFAPQGTVVFNGSGTASAPQQLEVMSNDLGLVPAGFNQNFAYNTLALGNNTQAQGNNTYVKLVDNSHNSSGTAPEALYVESLIVPLGNTLDLNGLHVYARSTEIFGTVLNGQISQLPPGGNLELNNSSSGIINSKYPSNDWTFFGRANQQVAVVVSLSRSNDLSVPLLPTLQYAQVQLEDNSGKVIASGTTATSEFASVILPDVVLPADGTYHIVVSTSASQPSTGNYTIGLFDTAVNTKSLTLNQTITSKLDSRYQVDRYTFTAQTNDQVQFNLVAASNAEIEFDLTGPNGYTAFSNATTSSSLITLPSDGAYTLTVHSTGPIGAYAFNVAETSQTALTLGTSYQGTLQARGQAQLFTVNVPTGGRQLNVALIDSNSFDQNQLYLSYGTAPTLSSSQYRYSNLASANQQILVPSAAAGTWYILLYSNKVTTPSQYALTATSELGVLTSISPFRHGNSSDTVMTLTGAGFNSATQVKLIASDGTTSYAAASVQVNTPTQMTATFAANAVPAGTYSVEVINSDGSTSTLSNAFKMVQGGTPNLVTNLTISNPIGRHIASTMYLTYANTGDAAMPAPLLELTAYNPAGQQGALMTLDPTLRVSGYWTSAIPQGYSSTIQILASGATPGLLQPGESITVPVYYAGWLTSQWDFNNPHLTFVISDLTADNTTTVDWSSLKSSLQPAGMSRSAWNAIYPNLTSQLGSTWGAYVQRLDQDASYLGSLGETVTDLGQLWSLELRQASGYSPLQTLSQTTDATIITPGPALSVDRALPNTINARTEMGPFGIGWQWISGWQRSLSVGTDGTVTIADPDGDAGPQQTTFQPDSRGGYFDVSGSAETLTQVSGGYLLQEQDGTVTMFGTNGLVAYVQDTHGNKVTAGYTSGLLTSLTASTGQSLSFTHNSASLILTVTDSAGRTTTYSYDPSNTYLVSVTDFAGRTTAYTYDTSSSSATRNALLTIQNPDGTVVHFTYDAEGRLAQQYMDNGTPGSATSILVSYTYGPGAKVSMTDAFGGTTSYFADARGLFVKMVDPLGNTTHYAYDENFDRTQVIDPAGQITSYVYDQNGKPIETRNPGGDLFAAAYKGPFDKMSSSTDANGNTTRYSYDNQGNLLAITYPNGSEHQFSYDPIGDLTTSINGRDQAITSAYNSMGQITRETFADGTYLAYTYNAQGQMLTSSDGTNTTTFQYDPTTENLLQVTYPGGKYLKFSYDSAGRRTQSVDQDGFTVNYAYKPGLLAGLTDGSGKPIVTYTYDAEGRLVRKDMGNGAYTTYEYDLDGSILHLINHAPDGTVNSRFDYAYNNLGRVTAMTTLDGVWTYQYDTDGRLTHAIFASSNTSVVPNQDLQYAYDMAGNRTQTIINGVTTTYATNNMNQYTQVGSTTLSYDPDGNLIQQTDSSGTTNYTYDELNRLIGAASPSGTVAYQYDTLGNLASLAQNGQVTRYVVDPIGLGHMVGEYTSSGSAIAKYTYGLGLTSRVDASGQAAYYDFDRIGSTVGMSGATGAYQNLYRYLPFGGTIASSGTIPNVFQFVGQYGVMTQAIGPDFMRARFYSSDLGRFLSPDPLGLAGGQSVLYAYAAQNPLSFLDPIGLCETQAQKDATDAQYEEEIQQTRNGLVVDTYILNTLAGYLQDTSNPLGALVFYLEQQDMLDKIQQLERKIDILIAQEASYDSIPICPDNTPDNPPPPPPSPPSPPPNPGSGGGGGTTVTTATATDPNALYGPAGYGPSHFIAPTNTTFFPYTIDFENASTATAPAQRVVITNQLDPNLDWTTFQLTSVGFGSNILTAPANSQSYQTTVSMTYNGQTFNVDIDASLNPTTGLLTVVFQSIDPNTSLPPSNVLTGFLPPEDGTGRGMGFVNYIISPKSSLADGTQIRNVALVTFDSNQAISTDQVNDEDPTQGIDPNKQAPVTFDSTPPTSTVSSLPANENTLKFNVAWSGSDGSGSGVASYNVYVSDNGGAYTLWQNQTTQSSATYNGVNGHTYGFYSVAFDNAGNAEAIPTAAEATTTAEVLAPTTVALTSDHPSGSTYGQSVTFTAVVSASSTPTGSVQFQVDGSNLGSAITLNNGTASLTTSALAAGSHQIGANYTSDTSNFANSSTSISQTISSATPTVSIVDAGGTYNGSSFSALGAALGVDGKTPVAGSFSYAYYTGNSATGTPSTTAPSNGGIYTVVGTFTSTDSNYANGAAQTTFTINSLGVTLTGSRTYDGTTSAAASLFTVSNLVSGDNLKLTGNVTLASANFGAENIASFAGLSLSGSSASNYTLTSATGSLNITPATPILSVNDGGAYNGKPFPATATGLGLDGKTSVSGSFSYAYYVGNSASGTASVTPPSNAGIYTVVAAFTSSDNNYSGGSAQTTFTISPANVSYIIGNDTQTYGRPANLTADLPSSFSTGINGEMLNITYSSSGDTSTAAIGSYPLTGVVSDGANLASNYTVTLTNGSLTVVPAPAGNPPAAPPPPSHSAGSPPAGPVGGLSLFAIGLGPTGIDLFEVDSQGDIFAQDLFGGGFQLVNTSLQLSLALLSDEGLLALLTADNGQIYPIEVFNPFLPSIEPALLTAL